MARKRNYPPPPPPTTLQDIAKALAPEPETTIAPITMKVLIIEADRRRDQCVRMLRELATSFQETAANIALDKLDADYNLTWPNRDTVIRVMEMLGTVNNDHETFKTLLGLKVLEKVEEHPAIIAAAKDTFTHR